MPTCVPSRATTPAFNVCKHIIRAIVMVEYKVVLLLKTEPKLYINIVYVLCGPLLKKKKLFIHIKEKIQHLQTV